VVVVWLVCRHLAAVVSVTYTTVVYTTVVTIVDLWSIHDGRVRNINLYILYNFVNLVKFVCKLFLRVKFPHDKFPVIFFRTN